MLGKRMLSRVGWVALVILAVVWIQAPVMAQEKAPDELAGVKVALAGQMFIIEQLKDNFDSLFSIASELEKQVSELGEEISSLKTTVAGQTKNIKELTEGLLKATEENDGLKAKIKSLSEEFLKVTEGLETRVNSLETENAGLQAQIDSLTAANNKLKSQRFLLGLGFLVAAYMYIAK